MLCPICNVENKPSAKFCTACGNSLTNEQFVKPSQGRMNKFKSSKSTTNPSPEKHSIMSFKRAKKGAIIFGLCKGLSNSGRGSAGLWRFIFVIVSLFLTGIPIIVYIVAGLIIPVDESEQLSQSASDATPSNNSEDLARIQNELVRLKELKDKDLINDEEYENLRKKTLESS